MEGAELAVELEDDGLPEDDRIIAVAFRWSVAIMLGVAVVVVAVVLLVHAGRDEEVIHAKELAPPPAMAGADETVPPIPFAEVGLEAGIDLVHCNGAAGERLLPETMGAGVAWLDFDNDGDQDLLFANGREWPWSVGSGACPGPRPTVRLYANDGSGQFQDVTRAAGLDISLQGMGVAAGDIDGDGWIDVYVTAIGRNRLLRNRHGRFEDVTAAAGAGGPDDSWSTSAGFADLDNDGDLDLVVCSYVTWSRQIDIEIGFTLNGRDRAYGPPTSFHGADPEVFRNDGGGRFTEVSAEAGLRVANPSTGEPVGKSLGLAIVDIDGDGLLDLFIANDTVRNLLFRNLGGWRFEEVGSSAGVGFDGAGKATGAMGVDAGDLRNDGSLALAIGNFSNEMSSLYVQQGAAWQFADSASIEGLGSPSRQRLSFGLFFFDVDLDGRLDLLQVNGHLEPEISEVQASQTYAQAPQLFWNRGPSSPACFIAMPDELVGDLAGPVVGRGSAFADMDGDGDLDMVLTTNGGRPRLFRNDQSLAHHWIRIDLDGIGANPDGVGARLLLEAGGTIQRRMVMPTRSYLSQSELPVTFGLGQADAVERLEVHWPDGTVQTLEGLEVDRTHRIVEPASADQPPA